MKRVAVLVLSVVGSLAAVQASALLPVVDVRAIVQLVQQINVLQNQLMSLRQQVQAVSGGRGMERLLAIAPAARNYLPKDWVELASVLDDVGADYGALRGELDAIVQRGAELPAARIAGFGADLSAAMERGRRATALAEALSRQALEASSARFGSLQTLIDQLGDSDDLKASQDLVARIGAEQAMLQNEHAKLDALWRTAEAQRALETQRLHELTIAQHGSFAARFNPVP